MGFIRHFKDEMPCTIQDKTTTEIEITAIVLRKLNKQNYYVIEWIGETPVYLWDIVASVEEEFEDIEVSWGRNHCSFKKLG